MDLGPEGSFKKFPTEIRVSGESYFLVRSKKGYQLLSSVCPHHGGEGSRRLGVHAHSPCSELCLLITGNWEAIRSPGVPRRGDRSPETGAVALVLA